MKITGIRQQVKRHDRYSIYIEENYAFSLSATALLEQKLKIGDEISSTQLENLKQLSSLDKLYNQALRYATLRPRSAWEIDFYLKRKKVDEKTTKKIINKLTALGLINDSTFAKAWVENLRLLKPVSRRRLVQELKQKRISNEIITDTLSNDDTDELQILRELIAKKRGQTKYKDELKLIQYLLRQGFNYDDIKTSLKG